MRLLILCLLFWPSYSYSVYRSLFLRLLEWDGLNDLFADSVFTLPDATASPSGIKVQFTELSCKELQISDLDLTKEDSTNSSSSDIALNITVRGVGLQCNTKYRFDTGVNIFNELAGEGTAQVYVRDSMVSTSLVLSSPQGFANAPPSEFSLKECQRNIQVYDLDFQGGAFGSVLNALERSLRGIVQRELGDFLCEALQELDNDVVVLLEKLGDLWQDFENEALLPSPNTTPTDFPPQVLDWLNPITTLEQALVWGVQQANDFLEEPAFGSLLEDDGGITLISSNTNLLTLETIVGNVTLSIVKARVLGLDTLSNFDPIVFLDNYTLSTSFVVDDLTVQADLEFTITPPSSLQGASPRTLVESFQVTWPLGSIAVDLDAVVAIDKNLLGDFALGNLFRPWNEIWDCLVPSLYDLSFPRLNVQMDPLQVPTFRGFDQLPGLQTMADQAMDALVQTLGPSLNVGGLVRSLSSKLIDSELNGTETCSNQQARTDEIIDFRDLLLSPSEAREFGGSGMSPYGRIGVLVKDVVDRQAGEWLVPRLNEWLGESVLWDDNFVNFNDTILIRDLEAQVLFQLGQLRLENLDTVRPPLDLIDPIVGLPHDLNNSASMGYEERPVRVSVVLELGLAAEGYELSNKVELGVELPSIQAVLDIMTMLSRQRLFDTPLGSVFDLNCLLSIIPTPELDDTGLRLSTATVTLRNLDILPEFGQFSLSCLDCSSPGVLEIEEILKSEEGQQSAARSAQNIIDFLLSAAESETSIVQSRIDRYLADAPSKCPHRPEYGSPSRVYRAFEVEAADQSSLNFLLAAFVSVLAIVIAMGLCTIVVKILVRRRHKKWVQSLSNRQKAVVCAQERKREEELVAINENSSSLFTSEYVPRFLRWGIPMILLANMALFLSGHLSVGGAVRVYLKLAGEEFSLDDFYSFSVAKATVELWEAGGKELAILILLFSGIWPYTKLLITFFLWIAKPSRVTVGKRGRVLEWLDALAKCSTVDIFVMIILLSAFDVSIQGPDLVILPDEFYRVDFAVVPLWGLYANMTAQLVAQLSSHVVIFYHRRVEEKAASRPEGSQKEPGNPETVSSPEQEEVSIDQRVPRQSQSIALYEHEFERPGHSNTGPLVLRRGTSVGVLFLAGVLVTLILCGTILPSFSFETLGLVGIAQEIGEESARKDYSVFALARGLGDQAKFLDSTKDYLGLYSIVTIMVLTVVVAPLLNVGLLLLQWFYPLCQEQRKRLSRILEVVQAWQYVEVYLLSVLVGAWQLPALSANLLGEECSGLTSTFAELVYFGFLRAEDGQCFQIRPSIEQGSYFLIAAAGAQVLLNTLVSQAALQAELSSSKPSLTERIDDVPPEDPLVNIVPPAILFSDRFRWLLVYKEDHGTSSRSNCGDEQSA